MKLIGRRRSRCLCELLENRQMLSIVWDNQTTDTSFNAFGDGAGIARAMINRALADWNAAIKSFNYASAEYQDTLHVNITAARLDGSAGVTYIDEVEPLTGKPVKARIELDLNGGGASWFFDSSVNDDSEFNRILTPYAAQSDSVRGWDLYQVALHEIGHVVGIGAFGDLGLVSKLVNTGVADPQDPNATLLLYYEGNTPKYLMTTNGGGHLYEGPVITDHADWPNHGFDLMNAGRVLPYQVDWQPKPDSFRRYPGSMAPTQRVLITPTDIQLLRSAYGYTVNTPPVYGEGGTVSFYGSTGDDVLVISQTVDSLSITRDGRPMAHFVPSSVRIIMIGTMAGNDRVTVDSSVTASLVLYGGPGNDILSGGSGTSVLYGGKGNDTLTGGFGPTYLYGEDDNDRLAAGKGITAAYGQNGNDTLVGGSNVCALYGGQGNDSLVGGTGTSRLFGDAGDDSLLSMSSVTAMIGGNGLDTYRDSNGNVWQD